MSNNKLNLIPKTFLWPVSQTLGITYSPLNSATLSCSSEVTLKMLPSLHNVLLYEYVLLSHFFLSKVQLGFLPWCQIVPKKSSGHIIETTKPPFWLHFVGFFHVASLFSTGVDGKKVRVDSEICRVLQTIQMKVILFQVWAEGAGLGRAKTAIKFKYEI